MFSPGNLRATFDNAAYEKLIAYYIGEKYTLRYTGGMVSQFWAVPLELFCPGGKRLLSPGVCVGSCAVLFAAPSPAPPWPSLPLPVLPVPAPRRCPMCSRSS